MNLKKLSLNEVFVFGFAARKQEINNGLHHYKRGIVEGREKASIDFDKPASGKPVADHDCTLRNCVRVGGLVMQSLMKAKKQHLNQVSFFLSLILFIALILFSLFTS